ncbi:unnamed protein product [Adineta steineri]|uniref:G-protein coupled receptors family 1 profile domain-containing protein n=1 Tax=Adineta steineri TaxID=433720 RepID=A0A819RQG5_9BILA|nr:unnamed protein product [Adineta steineri]CAF4048734.1 unnamed protein product [Adineta steineri]
MLSLASRSLSNLSINSSTSLETDINSIKYIILLSFLIVSLVLSLFIFYHILITPATRKLNCHIIIILLCLNFLQTSTDLPILISIFHTGYLRPASSVFCTFWVWYDFSLNAMGICLMAFASIERHIIVFKWKFFQNQIKRYIFHYLPIIIILCWIPLFYIVAVVISPTCQQNWSYNLISCGQPCYVLYDKYLSGFDFIFHLLISIIIIAISNLTLCIRIIYQKRKIQHAADQRRQQKMAIQLISIAALYIAGWFPSIIIQLIQLYFDPSFLAYQLESILFSIYFVPLLLPAICLRIVPQLTKRFYAITGRKL